MISVSTCLVGVVSVDSITLLVVDSALEVIDDYHAMILKLEHDILLKPKMTTVRYCKPTINLLLGKIYGTLQCTSSPVT